MEIRQYLAEEGLEGRIDGAEFEKLKDCVGAEGRMEFDDNFPGSGFNPTSIKVYYELLAKYNMLDKFNALLFDELIVHMPEIADKIKPYERVLDAGCSSGLRLAYYAQECPGSSFLGIDYSSGSIALAEERIKKRQLTNVRVKLLDISDVAALNEKFDCITATNVLHEKLVASFNYYCGGEWKQDIASGLYFLGNALKSSGMLMFTLHFCEQVVKEHIIETEIDYGLRNAGLEVEEQSDVVFSHFSNQTINGLWVCRKR